jgi:hypothetical protein
VLGAVAFCFVKMPPCRWLVVIVSRSPGVASSMTVIISAWVCSLEGSAAESVAVQLVYESYRPERLLSGSLFT